MNCDFSAILTKDFTAKHCIRDTRDVNFYYGQGLNWKRTSAGMGTVGVWLQMWYCVLNIVFCNYLTKEVVVLVWLPGGQGSAGKRYFYLFNIKIVHEKHSKNT